MFREIREIKTSEKLNNNKIKREEGYRLIKPETDITVDEAKAFVMSLFAGGEES